MTKIVGTLGPKSRTVEIISGCLKAEMSVARFDFSWGDTKFHQETLENLKVAIKSTKKLCAVMLDTVGPELQVANKTEQPISLQADSLVALTPDQDKEASSNLLPINYTGLSEAEKVHNQDLYFERAVKYVGEPMTHLESIASSAVRAAIKVKASVIICFTSSGRAARLIAKYMPTMPVLSVVIPQLKTSQLRWTFTGASEARQSFIVRGLFPMLADPRHRAESTNATNESVLDHGKASKLSYSRVRPYSSSTTTILPFNFPYYNCYNFSLKSQNHHKKFLYLAPSAAESDSSGPLSENDENEQNEIGETGGENGNGNGRPRLNLKWVDLLLDPDPDNVVAVGLTGVLAWASVQVLWQIFVISIATLLTALKYSFVAALLVLIPITLLWYYYCYYFILHLSRFGVL